LDEARAALGDKEPRDWKGQVHAVKAALVSRALDYQERAEQLIRFADGIGPDGDLDDWEQLARSIGVTDHDDHYVREYEKVDWSWPSIKSLPGHGYWPPQTPYQGGYEKGLNLGVRFCPYLETTSEEIADWNAGFDAGYARRCEIELEIGNCPHCGCTHPAHEGAVCEAVIPPEGELCGCDQTEQSAAMPDRSDQGPAEGVFTVWLAPSGGGQRAQQVYPNEPLED
jgi:hypothetical protein